MLKKEYDVQIIDNFLEKDLIVHLDQYLTYKTPYWFNHGTRATNDNHYEGKNFGRCNLNVNDILYNYIFNKIQKKINKKVICEDLYLNLHFADQPGDWHQDPYDLTFILMTSATRHSTDGCFMYKKNKKIVRVKFVQNRLLVFPASIEHKALDSKEPHYSRITMAFKCREIQK